MLRPDELTASQTSDGREARIRALVEQLRPRADTVLRQMAERLVDLPEQQSFGPIEYDLRDLGHELARASHQIGLQAGKKRATRRPVASAPTAPPTPASSATGQRPG